MYSIKDKIDSLIRLCYETDTNILNRLKQEGFTISNHDELAQVFIKDVFSIAKYFCFSDNKLVKEEIETLNAIFSLHLNLSYELYSDLLGVENFYVSENEPLNLEIFKILEEIEKCENKNSSHEIISNFIDILEDMAQVIIKSDNLVTMSEKEAFSNYFSELRAIYHCPNDIKIRDFSLVKHNTK